MSVSYLKNLFMQRRKTQSKVNDKIYFGGMPFSVSSLWRHDHDFYEKMVTTTISSDTSL